MAAAAVVVGAWERAVAAVAVVVAADLSAGAPDATGVVDSAPADSASAPGAARRCLTSGVRNAQT